MALDRDGRVWGWGVDVFGGLNEDCGGVSSPVPVLAAINSFGPFSQLQCAVFLDCLALTRAGDVILFGSNSPGQKLSLPPGRRGIYLGATNLFVYGLLDDGKIFVFSAEQPLTPIFIDTSGVPIN
jgi:hypothetical protein